MTTMIMGIEDALQKLPRDEWTTNPIIYKEMHGCRRLNGIIRNHIMQGGVNIQCFDDISAEVMAILQMKMLSKLDEPKSFYYVAYRVAQLVVSSYRKRDFNTFHSSEVSLDAPHGFDAEDQENSGLMGLITYETTLDDFSEDVIHRVDIQNAKDNLVNKLNRLGWPADIPRQHKRIGRPRKSA